jgi:acyl carrier protein
MLREIERQRRTHQVPRDAGKPRERHRHKVAAVFKDVLGVETVGADVSFFALGGTSLLAMRILSRLRRELGIDVEPDALLDDDITISELGKRIDDLVAGSEQALLESTLDRVSGLSDAEVARMLEETESVLD